MRNHRLTGVRRSSLAAQRFLGVSGLPQLRYCRNRRSGGQVGSEGLAGWAQRKSTAFGATQGSGFRPDFTGGVHRKRSWKLEAEGAKQSINASTSLATRSVEERKPREQSSLPLGGAAIPIIANVRQFLWT
jgi:hypothetical protein